MSDADFMSTGQSGSFARGDRWITPLMLLVVVPAGLAFLVNLGFDQLLISPFLSGLFRLLGLDQYNTRVVVFGTTLLGAASGVVGSFALLRKQALMGDVLAHAMLPGIGLAFIVLVQLGGDGKSLFGLLVGAAIFGLISLASVTAIRSTTRLKDDAALGIVLSVFFGLGIAILGVIQKMKQGNAAGLESFIYGKPASMLLSDVRLIAMVGALTCWYSAILFKEFALVCFDQEFAGAQGWRVRLLDATMMTLVIAITVIGLQAVGLILVIAMLIIPAAAARFWTDHLPRMVLVAAAVGAVSGLAGAILSAVVSDLPAGAIIVVVASCLFALSMLFGTSRGVLHRAVQHWSVRRSIGAQHLLRAIFEWEESTGEPAISRQQLAAQRSWSTSELASLIRRAQREDLLAIDRDSGCRLTALGKRQAARLVRNHRLWELYLITHADIAPSHVDRDADQIEHVLGTKMVQQLEQLLDEQHLPTDVPPSPHTMDDSARGGKA